MRWTGRDWRRGTPKEVPRPCYAGVAIICRRGQVRVPSANGRSDRGDSMVELASITITIIGVKTDTTCRTWQFQYSGINAILLTPVHGGRFPDDMPVASEVESELSGPSRRPQEKYSGDMTGESPLSPSLAACHCTLMRHSCIFPSFPRPIPSFPSRSFPAS